MSGFQIIDDSWKQRSDAIYGWYLIYRSNSHIRRCVGPDIFRHVLKYLLWIDLTVPLYIDNIISIRLCGNDEGYCWANTGNYFTSRTPCHVCLRPCVEFTDVLCRNHTHKVYKCGRETDERRVLIDKIWHCKCNASFIRMKDACVQKIPYVILS